MISIALVLYKESFLQLSKFQPKTILAALVFLSPGLDVRVRPVEMKQVGPICLTKSQRNPKIARRTNHLSVQIKEMK